MDAQENDQHSEGNLNMHIIPQEEMETSRRGLQMLDGRRVKKSSFVLDDNPQAIAKLVEGDQKKISKAKAHFDGRGNVLADQKILADLSFFS